MPRTPLEAYAFDARFGKWSVFILDPRLTLYLNICLQVVAKNSMGFGPESGEVKAKKSGIGETSNDLYISAQ